MALQSSLVTRGFGADPLLATRGFGSTVAAPELDGPRDPISVIILGGNYHTTVTIQGDAALDQHALAGQSSVTIQGNAALDQAALMNQKNPTITGKVTY